MPEPMIVAKAGKAEFALQPALANRHGRIASASGSATAPALQNRVR